MVVFVLGGDGEREVGGVAVVEGVEGDAAFVFSCQGVSDGVTDTDDVSRASFRECELNGCMAPR